MALDDAQRKAAILDEIGDAGGTLATKVDAQWDKYAAFEAIAPTLHDLYTKRGLIDIAYGQIREDVDFTNGDHSQRASQAVKALLDLRKEVTDEIALATEIAQIDGAGLIATGELATVAPEAPPTRPLVRPYGPDALDPEYLGDPYYPTRTRGGRWR